MWIRYLNVGQGAILPGTDIRSAINKQPTEGPLYLSRTGFAGDEQADLKYHGGPDKAVCVYPFEHYAYWEEQVGRPLTPAAFGENFTAEGMTEAEVLIGDLYRVGGAQGKGALVQVCQPRIPCNKVNLKFGNKEMVKRVTETGFSGYYLRVVEEGWVAAGDVINLVERDPAAPSILFANQIRYHEKENRAAMERLVNTPAIAEAWINGIRSRLASLA